ncbi:MULTISPECIES: SLAC1 family transporter [Streptomyces]|uniref:SLAC1 family transporter n=1 Tax=Streptomyces TaxID=1883 RepID=UPI0004CD0081|nr:MULTISPECIES: hypothetical protein [Streptomyces]KOT60595.1 hypothetical protein ADK43_14250 [Streptomyces rimosus subsp. rimosus]
MTVVAGWATSLIPVLLAAGVWRHVRHRVPLRYEPSWWSAVFPIGMYAVAWAALGAWAVVGAAVLVERSHRRVAE